MMRMYAHTMMRMYSSVIIICWVMGAVAVPLNEGEENRGRFSKDASK